MLLCNFEQVDKLQFFKNGSVIEANVYSIYSQGTLNLNNIAYTLKGH